MRKAVIAWAMVTVAVACAFFVAGSMWRGRRQAEVEVARARFFEQAQGQFHWPEGSKEWAELLVPLGGFDFREYGDDWRFTVLYEGIARACALQVLVRDTAGKRLVAGARALDRAVPEEVAVDLAGLKKRGLDLAHVQELVLRVKADGRAGRLLVSGLVSPRPTLSKRADR